MANETKLQHYVIVAAFLDSAIAPYFRAAAVMPNLVHLVNFQGKSDSVKLRKAGSLSATLASEATAHATSEYSETALATLQAAEMKVYVELSRAAEKFGGASVEELAAECGRALAQKFDVDALALINSLNGGTNVGTSGADATMENLLYATYILKSNNIPGPYVGLFHPVQLFDLQKELAASSASIWTNPAQLDLMTGQPPASNGYAGQLLEIPIYSSTNTESLNTGADWAGGIWSPNYALAAGFSGGIETRIGYNVAKGVTEIGVSLWYDVKEYIDTAGVCIATDQ